MPTFGTGTNGTETEDKGRESQLQSVRSRRPFDRVAYYLEVPHRSPYVGRTTT